MLRLSYCDQSASGVCLSVHLSLKPAIIFQWNVTEMILRWWTFKILQRFEFHEELWHGNRKKKIFLAQTVIAIASSSGQNTSNYGPGVEIGPMLWSLRFYIEINKEIFKNLFVPISKDQSFHMWHVTSSSGPLLKCFNVFDFEHDWAYTLIGHGGIKPRSKVQV